MWPTTARRLLSGTAAPFTNITRSELKELLRDQTKKLVLIDVRTQQETAHGMIPSAENVPVNELTMALTMSPEEFQSNYGFDKPTQDDNIVFYCKKGTRSLFAAQTAHQLGYQRVRNYPGSWDEWSETELYKS